MVDILLKYQVVGVATRHSPLTEAEKASLKLHEVELVLDPMDHPGLRESQSHSHEGLVQTLEPILKASLRRRTGFELFRVTEFFNVAQEFYAVRAAVRGTNAKINFNKNFSRKGNAERLYNAEESDFIVNAEGRVYRKTGIAGRPGPTSSPTTHELTVELQDGELAKRPPERKGYSADSSRHGSTIGWALPGPSCSTGSNGVSASGAPTSTADGVREVVNQAFPSEFGGARTHRNGLEVEREEGELDDTQVSEMNTLPLSTSATQNVQASATLSVHAQAERGTDPSTLNTSDGLDPPMPDSSAHPGRNRAIKAGAVALQRLMDTRFPGWSSPAGPGQENRTSENEDGEGSRRPQRSRSLSQGQSAASVERTPPGHTNPFHGASFAQYRETQVCFDVLEEVDEFKTVDYRARMWERVLRAAVANGGRDWYLRFARARPATRLPEQLEVTPPSRSSSDDRQFMPIRISQENPWLDSRKAPSRIVWELLRDYFLLWFAVLAIAVCLGYAGVVAAAAAATRATGFFCF